MPLNYHLDYSVRYSGDSELKNLYQWSIQEFDGEGQKVERDLIPWEWTLTFTATEIVHHQQIAIGDRYRWAGPNEPEPDLDKPAPVTEREHIKVDLRPGYFNEDPRWATSFSMIGTKTPINSIALWIYPVENEGDPETCRATAGLSYTSEVDFRNETQEEYLQFYLMVSRERFREFTQRVQAGDFDIATLRVGHVHGFYSDWSPSISTDKVKVLTRPKDHKLELPEGVEVPTIGKVDEFDFTMLSRKKMAVPIVSPANDDADDSAEALDPAAYDRAQTDRLIKQVTELGEKAKKAQIALWIIAALLLLSLLK